MAAPKRKTTIMALPNRKPLVLARYGTMQNFIRVAAPWLEGAIPKDQGMLTKILEQEPCTPQQATAVEKALEILIDRPQKILEQLEDQYQNQDKFDLTLTVSDMACLQAALSLRSATNGD